MESAPIADLRARRCPPWARPLGWPRRQFSHS